MNESHDPDHTWITERLDTIQRVETVFSNSPEAQLTAGITIMHEISERSAIIARELALQGVTEQVLTKKAAAAMLEVTPATISRWLIAQAADAPGTPPPDQGHHPAT